LTSIKTYVWLRPKIVVCFEYQTCYSWYSNLYL